MQRSRGLFCIVSLGVSFALQGYQPFSVFPELFLRMKRSIWYILITMALLFTSASIVSGAIVTQGIPYQGILTDSSGNPLTGTYSVTFRLYDVATGGTALSTDTHSVTTTQGLFTTTLTFGPQYFDGRALWLGVKVGSDAEM